MSEQPQQIQKENTLRLFLSKFAVLKSYALLIAATALLLLGWQWLETRVRLADLQQTLAHRLSESEILAKETRLAAQQTQGGVTALSSRINLLEAKIAEFQSQQAAVDALYQELTRSRDERLLAEVEQSVTIAAQQLQLAANVEIALIALQGADARLARSAHPEYIGLRKVLAQDIQTLKSLPLADIPGIALSLDAIVENINIMPLAFETNPHQQIQHPAHLPSQGWAQGSVIAWVEQLSAELWQEIKNLVRVERLDRPDLGLLAPSQTFFLRENLKLRLLDARLALLQRDGKSFREDVKQAQTWLERYFDTRTPLVRNALATLKQTAVIDLNFSLPMLNDTLTMLRNLKALH